MRYNGPKGGKLQSLGYGRAPKAGTNLPKALSMKLRYRVWLSLLPLFCGWSSAQAQDPQFSQLFSNQVLLNPAFTGAGQGPRIAFNFRRQWAFIPGAYRTFALAYDQPVQFGRTNHGLGLSIMADQAGEGNLTKLDFLANYAYEIPLTKNVNQVSALRLGLSFGIQQASLDYLNLRFPEQFDPLTGFTGGQPGEVGIESRINEDISFGALYVHKLFFVGASVHHITTPRQQFIETGNVQPPGAELPMRVQAIAGARFQVTKYADKNIFVSPAFMFRNQGPFQQIDFGVYAEREPLVIGLWYRNQDAVIAIVGLKYRNFNIGYSYDATVSELTNGLSGGSHEVSVSVEFNQPRSIRRPKSNMACPKF